jgi:hypothetical protein
MEATWHLGYLCLLWLKIPNQNLETPKAILRAPYQSFQNGPSVEQCPGKKVLYETGWICIPVISFWI